jgi:hypothetical protein
MTKPSWFFWIVAIFALLWNAFGVYDYWMTITNNQAYLKEFDPKMIAWIQEFPAWRKLVWLIGVASGMLAAILLILRRKIAAPLFLLSLAAMIVGLVVHDLLLANGAEMYGRVEFVIIGVLIVVQTLLWRYSARAAKRGYLA